MGNRHLPEPKEISHHTATIDGVLFHYAEVGDGPLVVCLHGFPEFWYSWRHQLASLSTAGYRVVAPDLRGYNDSGKPHGVSAYRIERLIDDVASLIEHLSAGPAVLLGHDWGGMIAWAVAAHRPDLVRALVALNAPHPRAYAASVRKPAQALRSWYMALFQLPYLPERLFRRGDFAKIEGMLRSGPVRPDAFSSEDIARYKEALGKPGALTSAINYYRAMRYRSSQRTLFDPPAVTVPAMLVWGDQDRFLIKQLAEASQSIVPQLRVEHLNASHWVQNDLPDEVNLLLLDFLALLG